MDQLDRERLTAMQALSEQMIHYIYRVNGLVARELHIEVYSAISNMCSLLFYALSKQGVEELIQRINRMGR